MERKFNFATGEFYHLYSRGVDKRLIFDDDKDRERFLKLLFVCNHSQPVVFRDIIKNTSIKDIFDFPADKSLVDIGAYCLMPNHFHILLREKVEGGISFFMKKLLTAYSKYYNTKNKRTGALFEGNFKASHLDDDNYLKYIYAYIHLNPVKLIYPKWRENKDFDLEKVTNFLNNYAYSSYNDYVGGGTRSAVILNQEEFPSYFDNFGDFSDMINFWLTYQE